MWRSTATGVDIVGEMRPGDETILTEKALGFVAELERLFGRRRLGLLQRRQERQEQFDTGVLPDFLPKTRAIREGDWQVDPVPSELRNRKVEITGPASSAKMVINALNSGANVYMADAEDSESPTWRNIVQGQLNLYQAARGKLEYQSPEKTYQLNQVTATLMFRPRGWHLTEKHVLVYGQPVSAALFDLGLFFFHNAQALWVYGNYSCFYLPKLESRLEAALWNEVFKFAEEFLCMPKGVIRATALIETIPAAFEMEEILYALKDHLVGLNCGRWDYIFSFIKKFRNRPDFVLPDRSELTMDKGFLSAYVDLLVQTCHRRGALAIGGMAAQIPIKNDPAGNEAALAKVRADKEREVKAGCDGTWVAHPALVPVAREVFDEYIPIRNQLFNLRPAVKVTAQNLLRVPQGKVTLHGIRQNINVTVKYLAAWLRGNGCVPINNLMEDAATAEISRAQLWQWVKHRVMVNGVTLTESFFSLSLRNECAKIKTEVGEEQFVTERYQLASELLQQMVTAAKCPEFLTLEAYHHL